MSARQLQSAVTAYSAGPRGARVARLVELVDSDNCPLARYLLGCALFDDRQHAHATQCMMVAHHQEPRLESAALLAFTGLLACERPEDDLLDLALAAWREFHQPEFDRTGLERRLLDAVAAPELPAGLSLLGVRLHRLPIDHLRQGLADSVVLRADRHLEIYATGPAAG